MSTNKFSIPGQWNFPKFEIVSGPQETVLQSGLTSTLDCSALSPEVPEVVWTKDGIALDPRRSGERRQLSNGSLVLSGSESLAGVYQCSLSLDSVGTILSPPALVRPPGSAVTGSAERRIWKVFIYFSNSLSSPPHLLIEKFYHNIDIHNNLPYLPYFKLH